MKEVYKSHSPFSDIRMELQKSSFNSSPRSFHSTPALPSAGVSGRACSVSSEPTTHPAANNEKHYTTNSRIVRGGDTFRDDQYLSSVNVFRSPQSKLDRNDSYLAQHSRRRLSIQPKEECKYKECRQKKTAADMIPLQNQGKNEYICRHCFQSRKWECADPQKTTLPKHERENILEMSDRYETIRRQRGVQQRPITPNKQAAQSYQEVYVNPGATHIPAINKRREEHLQKALRSFREENDSLRTRLSKLTSANLRHNNASIADLSDGRRPTKLGEEFTQLYDNEWTDAFDSLQDSRGEASAIACLLQIVEKAYEFCCWHAKRQLITFKQLLVKPATFSLETKSDERRDKLISLDAEDSLAFSELRRKLADHSLLDIQQSFRDKNPSWFGGDLTRYTEKCLELSWFMSLHSPPVAMDTLPKPGDPFNKSKYRAYTRDGARVAFVVWPAIFLHAGGPVLAKGVVQGQ